MVGEAARSGYEVIGFHDFRLADLARLLGASQAALRDNRIMGEKLVQSINQSVIKLETDVAVHISLLQI